MIPFPWQYHLAQLVTPNLTLPEYLYDAVWI